MGKYLFHYYVSFIFSLFCFGLGQLGCQPILSSLGRADLGLGRGECVTIWVSGYLNFVLDLCSATLCSAAACLKPSCRSITSCLF